MKMTRKIIALLIIVPVLTLGAGVVSGMLAARLPASSDPQQQQRTLLVAELDLSDAQHAQMRTIWESAQGKMQRTFEKAQSLQDQREQALISLLTDEQKAKFEPIAKSFADRRAELDKTRDNAFQDAVDASKALMSDAQKQKYDRLLKEARVGPLGGAGNSNGL